MTPFMRNVTILGALSMAAIALHGQEAEEETIFELSPFTVQSEQDFGYRVVNSMTATRIGVSLQQVPLSVQVITEEFVKDLGINGFADSLRYVSSAVGDTLSDSGQSGNTYLRGFPTAWTLRNGFRRYRAMVVENADRLEVVKGPVSVFFGQAAPGGITNIITKRPEFFRSGIFTTTYGSYDRKRAELEYNLPIIDNVLAVRLFGSYEDRDDWRDYEWKRSQYLSPSIRWRPTSNTDIIFEYEYFRSEENNANAAIYGNQAAFDNYENPDPLLLALYRGNLATLQRIWRSINISQWEVDFNNRNVNLPIPMDQARYMPEISPSGWAWNGNGPDAFLEYDSDDYIFEVKQKLTDWLDLRAGVNYNESSSLDVRFHSADRPYPDGGIDLIRGNAGGYAENDNLTAQADALTRFSLGPTVHRFLIGYERVEDDYREGPPVFNYNLASEFITPTPDPYGQSRTLQQMFQRYYPFFDTVQPSAGMAFEGVAPGWTRDESSTRDGYYLNHQGEFFNSRLNTMAGVRREEFSISSAGTVPTEYADTVYMGGMTFQVIDGLNFYASYSQSFEPNRPPNNLTIRGNGVLPGEASLLPPKSGEGIDIGFKYSLMDNKLTGLISFFNLQQEASVTRDDDRTDADPRNQDSDSTNDVTWYRTAGQYESEGLEIEVIYSPTLNYQLVAAFSWMWRANLMEDPNLPPDHGLFDRRNQNSPEYKLSLWNKYTFSEGRFEGLELGLGMRYMDDHFPRSGLGSTQMLVNESFVVFDGLIAYNTKIAGFDTRFALQMENLTDEIYQEGHTAAGSPFKANFSVRVQF